MTMTLTKFNRKPNSIPVGYITKPAIDVVKGDAVEGMGVIRKIVYVGQHNFDLGGGALYSTAGIEFQTVSSLTGKKLYFVLPMDAPLKVMQYAVIDEYEFDYLPLTSTEVIFSSKDSSWFVNLENFLGDEMESIIE